MTKRKRYSFLKMSNLAEQAGYALHDRREDKTIRKGIIPKYELWKDGRVIAFGDSLTEVKGQCDRAKLKVFNGL